MPDLTDTQLDKQIEALKLGQPRRGGKRKPIAHGTFPGARQHRYRKEPLCGPCREAENTYHREYKRANQQAVYLTEEEWQAKKAARSSQAGAE